MAAEAVMIVRMILMRAELCADRRGWPLVRTLFCLSWAVLGGAKALDAILHQKIAGEHLKVGASFPAEVVRVAPAVRVALSSAFDDRFFFHIYQTLHGTCRLWLWHCYIM